MAPHPFRKLRGVALHETTLELVFGADFGKRLACCFGPDQFERVSRHRLPKITIKYNDKVAMSKPTCAQKTQ